MLKKLIKIIEYYFDEEINENTPIDNLKTNEIDYYDLLMDIEDEFEISIDLDEIENIKNVRELLDYVIDEKSSS